MQKRSRKEKELKLRGGRTELIFQKVKKMKEITSDRSENGGHTKVRKLKEERE